MRKKVIKASKGPKEKAFTCPKCHNNTLYDLSESVTRVADVDHGDQFICDECGAEFYAEPQVDGTIQFKTKKSRQSVESATVTAALVDTPQEVIDELIEILDKYGFILDPEFEPNPGRTWFGDIHMQVINPNSYVDEYDSTVRDYISDAMISEIHGLEDRSSCPITWSFGAAHDGHVTGGLDIRKKHVPDDVESATDVQGADYGGAYDIDPEMFFTKEDIVDFGNEVCEKLTERFDRPFEIADVYIELPQKLSLFVSDPDWNEYSCSVPLDMRRIKIPADLTRKYLDTFVDSLSVDIEKDAEIYSATALPEGQVRRKAKDLHDELLETAADLLQSDDFGFDLSDVADILTIDVQSPRQPNDPIRVELRCELSYEGMRKLEDVLDPVVQQHDSDAYFDDVEPGIAEAFIRV